MQTDKIPNTTLNDFYQEVAARLPEGITKEIPLSIIPKATTDA